jgi:hypothetical protein
MAGRGDRLRFALDHNFPAPVLGAFGLMMPNVELVAIADIDDEFTELSTAAGEDVTVRPAAS